MALKPALHGRDHHRLGADPIPANDPIYTCKVFADWQNVRTGDGRFIFAIDEDIDGYSLTKVEMYVTTASSSGIVQVQLHKTGSLDMLSTRIQIDANELHSSSAATAYVINTANATVAHANQISIDVDAAGTNARGLGVHLTFSP